MNKTQDDLVKQISEYVTYLGYAEEAYVRAVLHMFRGTKQTPTQELLKASCIVVDDYEAAKGSVTDVLLSEATSESLRSALICAWNDVDKRTDSCIINVVKLLDGRTIGSALQNMLERLKTYVTQKQKRVGRDISTVYQSVNPVSVGGRGPRVLGFAQSKAKR